MKNLICFCVAALMLVSLTLPSLAMTQDGSANGLKPDDVLWHWSVTDPCAINVYKDSAHTEQILDSSVLVQGKTYYYTLACIEGYYVDNVTTDFEQIDLKSFVFNDTLSIVPEGYLAGDFDYNYTVNVMDAIHIVKYGLHHQYDEETINLRAADFNQDGYVDTRDAIQVVNTLVGLEENPYGGVQSDFEVVTDIPYELGEEIAISVNGTLYNEELDFYHPCDPDPVTVISSVEEFEKYWEEKTDEIEKVDPYSNPDDEVGAEMYEEYCQYIRDTYPLDKEALFTKYDESFFAENNLVITAQSNWESDKFLSFNKINGVPTVNHFSYRGGALEAPERYMIRLIAVDKDEIPADTEITTRVTYSYHIC